MTSPKDGPKPADKGASPASSPTKPGTVPPTGKPELNRSEPAKPGATGSSALPGSPSSSSGGTTGAPGRPQDARPSEPAKTGSTGSSPVPPVGSGPRPSEPGKSPEPAKPASAVAPGSSTGAPSNPPSGTSSFGTPSKPGTTASGAVPPVASAAKPSEPVKTTEPGKPTGATPSATGAASNTAPGAAPLKPGATGSSAIPPASGAAKPGEVKPDSPAKPGATGSSAIKPEVPPAGAGRSGAGPSGTTAGNPSGTSSNAGPTRVTEAASLTDGPILDMKAKRVPDPAEAGKGADKGADKGGTRPDAAKDAARDAARGETKAPPAATTKAGPGLGAVAASGLLGGLIGAGLLYGVTTYHRSSDPRLDNLDKAVAGLATKDAFGGLDKRIAANEQALKPLPEAVGRAEAAAKSAAERAQEALQKAGSAPAAPATEGAAPAPAVPADLAARLDALDQRVSALQEEPGREGNAEAKAVAAPTGDGTALAGLDERLKAVEAATKDAVSKNAAPAPDLTQKLTALQGEIESRTKANETADAGLAKRLDEVQKSLDAKIGAATQAVQEAAQAGKQAAEAGQARAEESVKGIDRRLQEQADKLASLDKALDQTAKAATVQSALRIVAADRIATSLDAGQPYPEALASLRNQEPADSKRVAALTPFADKGAPTAAKLAAEFRGIATKIAEAKRAAQARTVAESGSVGDRLMNMASSLVQVKRADAPAPSQGGAGGEVSTQQVQTALDNGDLPAAATAFAALPEEAKAQAGDFGTRLAARAEAGRAAQSLLADAFTGLPPAR